MIMKKNLYQTMMLTICLLLMAPFIGLSAFTLETDAQIEVNNMTFDVSGTVDELEVGSETFTVTVVSGNFIDIYTIRSVNPYKIRLIHFCYGFTDGAAN